MISEYFSGQSITTADQALRDQLRIHEGYRTDIYIDTEGHATVGIGHLIVRGDPEHSKPKGTEVTADRVEKLFTKDLEKALKCCNDVFPKFGSYPQDAQRVLANMMFNLGVGNFKKFTKLCAAVEKREWDEAANEMVASKWYSQVKGRARELVETMRKVGKERRLGIQRH